MITTRPINASSIRASTSNIERNMRPQDTSKSPGKSIYAGKKYVLLKIHFCFLPKERSRILGRPNPRTPQGAQGSPDGLGGNMFFLEFHFHSLSNQKISDSRKSKPQDTPIRPRKPGWPGKRYVLLKTTFCFFSKARSRILGNPSPRTSQGTQWSPGGLGRSPFFLKLHFCSLSKERSRILGSQAQLA